MARRIPNLAAASSNVSDAELAPSRNAEIGAAGSAVARAIHKRNPDLAGDLSGDDILIEDAQGIENALSKLMAGADVDEVETMAHVYFIENNEEAKIWSGPGADFSLDTLARQHGSGKYRLRIYVKTEHGNYAKRIDRVMMHRLPAAEDARLRAIRNGEIPANGGALTAEAVARMVADAVRAAQPAQPAVDPMTMMRNMAEMVRMMQPQAPAVPAVSPLEIIKMTAGFMRDIQGTREPLDGGVNAGAGDVFMKLIDKFAPLYVEQLSKQPQPAALPSPGPQGAAPQPGADDMSMRLKMGLAFLVNQAAANNDPETYADMILDNVPEAELRAMFAKPDWLDILASYTPAVKNYAEWFGELKKACEVTWAAAKPETPAA